MQKYIWKFFKWNSQQGKLRGICQFLLICDVWQDEEHPEVDAKDEDDLEDNLAHDRLSEVEGPVHHHGTKLDQHHDEKGSRHLILWQRWRDVCCRVFLHGKVHMKLDDENQHYNCHLRWILRSSFTAELKTYTKGPESKHDDDEVDRVGEEHQHIDVRDRAVLWVNQVIEKLLHGQVDIQNPTESRISVINDGWWGLYSSFNFLCLPF